MKINLDIEIKKMWKKFIILAVVLIAVDTLASFLLSKKYAYFNFSYFVGIILIAPYLPNFFTLRKIKCPNCGKNYFTPFFADREKLKTLVKSHPKCINCNFEAEIISELTTMY